MKYRNLELGEVIENGDQFKHLTGEMWRPVSLSIQSVFGDEQARDYEVRRPVPDEVCLGYCRGVYKCHACQDEILIQSLYLSEAAEHLKFCWQCGVKFFGPIERDPNE